MRLNIACASRISIVAPDASDIVGAFQHDKIMLPFPPQANSRREAAKAGPNDHYFERAIVWVLSVEHAPSASLCCRDRNQTEA